MYLLKSFLTICDTIGCSPPGYNVHGIFQWIQGIFLAQGIKPASLMSPALAGVCYCMALVVKISSSRGSSWSRDQTRFSYVSCIGWCVLYH